MSKPMIRFEGYDEDWEKVKLGDVVDVKTGSSNVQDAKVYGDYRFFDRSVNVSFMDAYEYDDEALIYPGEGSSFFPMYFKGKYALHQRAYSLTSETANMYYLNYYLMTMNDHFIRTSVGSTVRSLRMNSFKKAPITIPKIEEQEQIGIFFKTLDDLISAEEEQLKNYEQYKSAMLQKMFPRKGRSFPDLRFSGFDEDWEEVKLGDALSYEQPTKYLVDSADYSTDFSTPVLTAGKTFLLGHTDELDGIYDKGDVILFDDFTTAFHYINFPFKVKSSATKFLTETSDKFDLRFVYESMKGIQHPTESHKRYWISEYQALSRFMPETEEQEQIGSFFKTLDDIINKKQEKIEQLKETKKAFLQKMFV